MPKLNRTVNASNRLCVSRYLPLYLHPSLALYLFLPLYVSVSSAVSESVSIAVSAASAGALIN